MNHLNAPTLSPEPPTPRPESPGVQSLVPDAPADLSPSDLLDEITQTILTYVVMDTEQAHAATLWIAMTWFINQIDVAPLALITAPEKACGKSQLLTIFSYLVAHPLSVANSTASFIFRVIESSQPTILIDEADTFLRDAGELKGIINAGHTRANAFVGRTEATPSGALAPKLFSVWCAKAFAGIGIEKHLPDATISRSIIITLRRKMPHEHVARLRHANRSVFTPLADKLAAFAKAFSSRIRSARPSLPDALSDRAQDNWEPLLAIAEIAGPKWIAHATAAALKISKSGEKSVSIGNELLADIQYAFDMRRVPKISTADLIGELASDDEKPWATYNRGKSISPRQLSRLLEPYGIRPKTVRLGAFDTPKGYDREQFIDAFARYLIAADAEEPTDKATPTAGGTSLPMAMREESAPGNSEPPSIEIDPETAF